MNSCELATYVTAIACFIFDSFPEDELPVICTMLTQLNDTLRTMIAQELLCKRRNEIAIQKGKNELINKEASEALKKELADALKKEIADIFNKDIANAIKKDAAD
jgi:hypothetical protein